MTYMYNSEQVVSKIHIQTFVNRV